MNLKKLMHETGADRMHVPIINDEPHPAIVALVAAATSELCAEVEWLNRIKFAFDEWIEKTEWVQENREGLFNHALGMHRADCMRVVIDGLRAEVERLTVDHASDSARLNFLDRNAEMRIGWDVGVAPFGNVSVTSVIMGKQTIRQAIDAAMLARIGEKGGAR